MSTGVVAAVTLSVAMIAPMMLVAASSDASPRSGGFTAFTSCAHHAPYHPASTCRWPGGSFQAAFVFRSKVGPRQVRGCFRTSGPAPFGGHHGCVSFGRLARKVYPLKLPSQVHGSYVVNFSWLVGDHGHFTSVARSRLKIVG